MDEPDYLDWETWQRMTIWLTENRNSIQLYEMFKADAIYSLYVDEWWKKQGWTEFPWKREALG